MNKTLDQCFALEDGKGRTADCRVRCFVPTQGEAMKEAVLLLTWLPSSPDFVTGPWLETIISGFREGLADVRAELDFLLIEHYAPSRYVQGGVELDFEEELGLVLFKDLTPSCNSAAANLRAGKRKNRTSDNATAVRDRRSVYWLPMCREAVEDVVGESLDASTPEPLYSVKAREVVA